MRTRRWPWLLAALILLPFGASSGDVHVIPAQGGAVSTRVIYASRAGVPLNSNRMSGGGTPAASSLNAILATAPNLGGLELVIDGPALIEASLVLYPHTTVTYLAGGGLYCQAGLNGPAMRNANWISSYGGGNPAFDGSTILDSDIHVRGPGFINCNRGNGTTGNCTSGDPRYALGGTGRFIGGVMFFGVKGLSFEGVTLYDPPSFGYWFSNVFGLRMADCSMIDPQAVNNPSGRNTDGIHLNGPIDDAVIRGCYLSTGDDALALNASDGHLQSGQAGIFGSYDLVYAGPITRVDAAGIHFTNCLSAVRMLPGTYLIDAINIQGSGTVYGHAILAGGFGTVPSNGGFMDRCHFDLDVNQSAIGDGFVNLSGSYGSFHLKARRSSGAGQAIGPVNLSYVTCDNLSLDLETVDRGAAGSGALIQITNGSQATNLDIRGNWLRPGQAQGTAPLVSVTSATIGRLTYRGRVDNCGGILAHTGGTVSAANVADSSATNLGTARAISTTAGIASLSGSGNVGVTTTGTFTTNTLTSQ